MTHFLLRLFTSKQRLHGTQNKRQIHFWRLIPRISSGVSHRLTNLRQQHNLALLFCVAAVELENTTIWRGCFYFLRKKKAREGAKSDKNAERRNSYKATLKGRDSTEIFAVRRRSQHKNKTSLWCCCALSQKDVLENVLRAEGHRTVFPAVQPLQAPSSRPMIHTSSALPPLLPPVTSRPSVRPQQIPKLRTEAHRRTQNVCFPPCEDSRLCDL